VEINEFFEKALILTFQGFMFFNPGSVMGNYHVLLKPLGSP
jgi:hypothetical protein